MNSNDFCDSVILIVCSLTYVVGSLGELEEGLFNFQGNIRFILHVQSYVCNIYAILAVY